MKTNHTPVRTSDPTGKMSNFLLEDFYAVLKFMDTEIPKKSPTHMIRKYR